MKYYVFLLILFFPFLSYASQLRLSATSSYAASRFIIEDCFGSPFPCNANWHIYPVSTSTDYYCSTREEGNGSSQLGIDTGCDWDQFPSVDAYSSSSLQYLFDNFMQTFALSPGNYIIYETLNNCFGKNQSACISGNTIYSTTTITITSGSNTTSTFYTTVMSTSTDAIVGNVFNTLYLLLWFFFFFIVFWITFKITKR